MGFSVGPVGFRGVCGKLSRAVGHGCLQGGADENAQPGSQGLAGRGSQFFVSVLRVSGRSLLGEVPSKEEADLPGRFCAVMLLWVGVAFSLVSVSRLFCSCSAPRAVLPRPSRRRRSSGPGSRWSLESYLIGLAAGCLPGGVPVDAATVSSCNAQAMLQVESFSFNGKFDLSAVSLWRVLRRARSR